MNIEDPFAIYRNNVYTYSWLFSSIEYWNSVYPHTHEEHCELRAPYSPETISFMIFLLTRNCIIELKVNPVELISFVEGDYNYKNVEPLNKLSGHPGIILSTSGTSGTPKIVLHDAIKLLSKFSGIRQKFTTMALMDYDHIGGLDVLFNTLCGGGCLVIPEYKTPDKILGLIEKYKVELLPAPPSFLNIVISTGLIHNYDLSSLKIITYGSEPIYEETLTTLHKILPDVKLKQTYGMTELGTLPTKSESSVSTLIKLGTEYLIKEGILYIKHPFSMLGLALLHLQLF